MLTKKVIIKRKKIKHPIRETNRSEKIKQLKDAGLRYVTFLWNEKEFLKIVELAEKENKKANDFIWGHLSKTLLNK